MNRKGTDIYAFLRDLCGLIKDSALNAKRELDAAPIEERDFALGRLMSYHEVVSLVQRQAVAFQIDVAELNLADIVPERDLV